MTRWCTAPARSSPACAGRDRWAAGRGSAWNCTRRRPASCTARTMTGVAIRAHVVHVPGVRVPAPAGQEQAREAFRVVPARGQQGGDEGYGPGDPLLALGQRSDKTLGDLARMFNSIVQGWINYYGRFYRSRLLYFLRRLDEHLVRWACRKYKRLRNAANGARGTGWPAPPGGLPGCSPTGSSAHVLTAGRWEPCEPRGSSTVLREAGGEIPPADSPSGLHPR